MTHTAYQFARHFTCLAAAFLPCRVARFALDNTILRFVPDEPIILTTDDGREVIL